MGTRNPGMCRRSCEVSSDTAGEEAAGAGGAGGSGGKKLLLPLAAAAAPSSSATGGNSPGGSRGAAWARSAATKGLAAVIPRAWAPPAARGVTERGRGGGRRKEQWWRDQKVEAVHSSGKSPPRWMHALGSLWIPGDASRPLEAGAGPGSAAWLGVGQPAWKQLQEAFPGLDLFSRERWEGGLEVAGLGAKASCLSS